MGRLSVLAVLLVASPLFISCSKEEVPQAAPEQTVGQEPEDAEETNGAVPPEPKGATNDEPEEATEGYTSVFTNADGELLCPVMEVILESEEVAEGYQDYKGVRYWFSTAESAKMFSDDPEKFAK
ncbi:MAG: hypothetical protein IH945_01845 [Armatimonadetes bacterium]|nr:hypothetical protein [Armatimonadota bacterium]